jgi:hypothetical protein
MSQYGGDAARGHNGRDTDKSAGAENNVWAKRGKGAARSQHTEGYTRGIGKISQREVAAELPGWDYNELNARFFSRSPFHAVAATDPDQVRQSAILPQLGDHS